LQDRFAPLATGLKDKESLILQELLSHQGHEVDLGGYYLLDDIKTDKAMRPSTSFNQMIDSF
jgi:isocitrate dehydrogenase